MFLLHFPVLCSFGTAVPAIVFTVLVVVSIVTVAVSFVRRRLASGLIAKVVRVDTLALKKSESFDLEYVRTRWCIQTMWVNTTLKTNLLAMMQHQFPILHSFVATVATIVLTHCIVVPIVAVAVCFVRWGLTSCRVIRVDAFALHSVTSFQESIGYIVS